jgi:hypothetical protein
VRRRLGNIISVAAATAAADALASFSSHDATAVDLPHPLPALQGRTPPAAG